MLTTEADDEWLVLHCYMRQSIGPLLEQRPDRPTQGEVPELQAACAADRFTDEMSRLLHQLPGLDSRPIGSRGMLLHSRRWGPPRADAVLCVHGVTQHGGVFEPLGRRLADRGHHVTAVDLRGHGASGHEPPWRIETHVEDILETVTTAGIEPTVWIGHSFGGQVAATLAARVPERVARLVLLDPALEVPPERALRSAEIDRLDWSFATAEGAMNALLATDAVVAAPRDTVAAYVTNDLVRGPDGRLRFSFCASAAVVAWSEMTLPAPPIANVPTLIVRPVASQIDGRRQDQRYRGALGSLVTFTVVPNGHNVLWESPAETITAIEDFLERTVGSSREG